MAESELARYRCPRCDRTFDVWLEDGKPEERPPGRIPADCCPTCIAPAPGGGLRVTQGSLDAEETGLYDGDS